jgi:hypothetical protein
MATATPPHLPSTGSHTINAVVVAFRSVPEGEGFATGFHAQVENCAYDALYCAPEGYDRIGHRLWMLFVNYATRDPGFVQLHTQLRAFLVSGQDCGWK